MPSSRNGDWQTHSKTALIQSSLDVLDQGITIFDADLKLVFANRKFLELRDLPPHLGKVETRFEEQIRFRAERGDYGPGHAEDLVQEHVELAKKFEAHRIERTQLDGRVLEIRGDPLSGGGFIATYSDITERKRAEEELLASENALQERVADLEEAHRKLEIQGEYLTSLADDLFIARDEARAADRAKSEFLASMSHELRTPLNAIIGFSEIIKDETFGPIGSVTYRDYAKDINESGQHLLGLINDILDLSKIESGTDELREDRIEVPEIVRSVLKLVGHRAEQRGIKIQVELPDRLPALRADERKLKQILVNLLANAVKFTDAGGEVALWAWCRIDSGYMFQIADTGIGMAPEDIPKALSRFGQVDGDLNRRYEGAGLGLPLTKALVEQHGGTLDMQSQVGVGTTVTVRLPAERIVASLDNSDSLDVEDRAAN